MRGAQRVRAPKSDWVRVWFEPTTYFTMKTFYEMAVYVGESMLTTGIRNISHNSNSSPSQDYPDPPQ